MEEEEAGRWRVTGSKLNGQDHACPSSCCPSSHFAQHVPPYDP